MVRKSKKTQKTRGWLYVSITLLLFILVVTVYAVTQGSDGCTWQTASTLPTIPAPLTWRVVDQTTCLGCSDLVMHQDHSNPPVEVSFERSKVYELTGWDHDSDPAPGQTNGTIELYDGVVLVHTWILPWMTDGQGLTYILPSAVEADRMVFTPGVRASGTIDSTGFNICTKPIVGPTSTPTVATPTPTLVSSPTPIPSSTPTPAVISSPTPTLPALDTPTPLPSPTPEILYHPYCYSYE